MMKCLITPAQVLRHAFGGGEMLSLQRVGEADIVAAEARYLRPVLGEKLHDALLAGRYADFTADYLVTCVALLTRHLVQPRLDLHTSQIGSLEPKADNGSAADPATLNRLRQNLRQEAMTLLRRAVAAIEADPSSFPEYDPQSNILNRCTTDGGFVQIF